METDYDIAVIGAGPVGLFASYFANLHGLKVILLESLNELGGQPNALYPAKTIRDIPVFAEISGKDLTKELIEQVEASQTTIKNNYQVTMIEENEDHSLKINDDLLVKSVLITTGNGAFAPKKVPFEYDSSLDKNVHYFLKDLEQFQNKNVAVLGGGDSALDWAEMLAEQNAHVSIVHRREQFRGLEGTVNSLKANDNVTFLTPYLPLSLTAGDDGTVNLTLKKMREDSEKSFNFDDIVVAYGFSTNNNVVEDWGLDTKQGFIEANRFMQTNLQNVYVAGDAATYENRVPIIALGFGEAQIAVTSIARTIFPDKQLTMHSTSIK